MSIPADTHIGHVSLTVADLDRSREFYERVIGLRTLDQAGDRLFLGADDDASVVELVGDPEAPPRRRGTTGLFHLAILLPSRAELASGLRRVVEAGWPLAGASDHLVSEALYLGDPEGNGIEIYRDRPRDEWRRVDGQLQMATLPLDLDSVLDELSATDGESPHAPAGTRIGHVHLNVADLAAAEAFYGGLMGFDVTVRDYPGAVFLSAGGYHHHIGANTWAGEGSPPARPGSRGLRRFEIVVPSAAALAEVERRLRDAGLDPQAEGEGIRVADPSGNGILLRG
ncbi:MAG TPA: VOC family protein [Solirubrobacterales bacterium]|jgi:catechol 2,3-dioxygenase|nr:VOC family protein [Solirubrobacterales bacterium]